MPLHIRYSPEPLSENSFSIEEGAPEPILIGSDSARHLANELREYCGGNTTGRSFLVAGHRGSGKSTLVAKAFLEIWKESERGTGIRRPLFVALNGPSLFLDPLAPVPSTNEGTDEHTDSSSDSDAKDAPDSAEADEESSADEKPARAGSKSEAQIVLEQIILGLHRAVAQEFTRRYRLRTEALVREATIASEEAPERIQIPAALSRTGLAELAAQFDAELMECPDGARLREYYNHVRRNNGTHGPIEGILGRTWAESPQFQAAAELLALSGTCEAHKRVSGNFTRTDKLDDKLVRDLEKAFGREATVKEYIAPLMPILVGGVAGVGAGVAGSGGLTAAAAGVLAALGSAAVVKYSSKRTVTRSRVENFIFDLSAATLDRALPVLIRRLWNAGLAPMFVVDELDKVDKLSERMQRIVHHLKKLVAENAFFCFLADREYFESMLRQGSSQAYPKEYTYYSRRLFTALQAHDFAAYLSDLFADAPPGARQTGGRSPILNRRPGSATAPVDGAPAAAPAADASDDAQPPPTATTASIHAGQIVAGGQAAADATARELLSWVLRHRSQLHPLDLQRQITALVGDRNYIDLTPRDVQRPAYLIDITMQVLIEALLNGDDVKYRIAGNHEDLRLVHDALYFITREWLGGAETLSIDKAGRAKFERYLEQRTGIRIESRKAQAADRDSGKTAQPKGDRKARKGAVSSQNQTRVAEVGAASGSQQSDGNCGALHKHERLFLFRLVERLAAALANTSLAETSPAGRLISAWEENVPRLDGRTADPVPSEVKSALLQADRSVLILKTQSAPTPQEPEGSIVYEWRYDPSGSRRGDQPDLGADEPARPTLELAAPHTDGTPPAPALDDADSGEPTHAPASAPDTDFALENRMNPLELIETFITMLNRAIGVPENESHYLRYDMLANQFRIMPTSPPWDGVEVAIRRVKKGRPRDAAHGIQDTGLMHDFCKMLESTKDNIVRAVACAAAIGSAIPDSQPRERVVLGLEILSRALRLATKTDPTPELEHLQSSLKSTFPTAFSPIGLLTEDGLRFPAAKSADLADRARVSLLGEEIGKFVRSVGNKLGLGTPLKWQSLLEDAWNSAKDRVLADLIGKPPQATARISEMLCAARGEGPEAILPFSFLQITAAQLTTALFQALRARQSTDQVGPGEVPAWVGLAAMHALGFGSFNTSHMQMLCFALGRSSSVSMKELPDLIAKGLLAKRRPPDATVIVIRRPKNSLVAEWLPRPDYLFMPGTVDEFEALLNLPLHNFISTGPQVIAVEMDRDSEKLPREFEMVEDELRIVDDIRTKWNLQRASVTYIYPQSPLTTKGVRTPMIIAPKSIEEIVGSATRNAPMS